MNKKFIKICTFYLLIVVVLMQLSFGLGGMSLNVSYADTEAGEENEIIRNGDFSSGSSQWSLFVDWAANASAYNIVTTNTEGDSISRTGVTYLGDYDRSIKLYQKDIAVENSKKYILSFDAWSSENREIKVRMEGGTNYTTYFERTLNLETSKKEYSFEFVMNHPTDLTSQLAFNFGYTSSLENQFHNIYIDNVSVIMLDTEPTPTPMPTSTPTPTHWPPYPWPTQPAESDNIQSSINLSRNTLSTVDLGRIVNMEFVQEGSLSVEGTIEAPKEIVMVLDNSGTFNSYIDNVPWPLDFGIYAHETLSIEGYEVNIDGSTYSRDFISTSNSLRITEKCSSFSTHITSPIIDVGEFENLTVPVEMPHFDAELMRDVIVFEPRDYMDEREKPMPGQEGITIRYDKDKKQFEILADTSTTFNIDDERRLFDGFVN
jgi:hypothetical protein